jgi:membrane protein implicated in regulation of membrane protease activity
MTLELVFLGCFGFGLIMSAFSFLSGAVDFGVDTDVDLEGIDVDGVEADLSGGELEGTDFDGSGEGDADVARISTYNFSAIMAFIATFGAAGYTLTHFYAVVPMLSVPAAVTAGIGGASLINLFLKRILVGRNRTLSATEMVGTVGRLSLPIRENGFGEIVYSDGGTIHSSGARSHDGRPIEKGTEVMVTRYEKGIAWVRRLEEVLPGVEQAVRRIESASAERISRRVRTSA